MAHLAYCYTTLTNLICKYNNNLRRDAKRKTTGVKNVKKELEKEGVIKNASNIYYTTRSDIVYPTHKIFTWLICEFEGRIYILPKTIDGVLAAKVLDNNALKEVTLKFLSSKGYEDGEYTYVPPLKEYSEEESEFAYMGNYIQSII